MQLRSCDVQADLSLKQTQKLHTHTHTHKFQHLGGSKTDRCGGVPALGHIAGKGCFCVSVPNFTIIGGLKSAVVRVFTPQKSANTKNLGFILASLDDLFNIYCTPL